MGLSFRVRKPVLPLIQTNWTAEAAESGSSAPSDVRGRMSKDQQLSYTRGAVVCQYGNEYEMRWEAAARKREGVASEDATPS